MKHSTIKEYLPLVKKPARYIGGEVGSVKKDASQVELTFALAFPDIYEIGTSHLGLQILYQILNSREEIAAERVYAPWADFEALLRDKGAPLSTLENNTVLSDFDILGFSLQYELSYTNILNMMELGGVPLYAKDRGDNDPLVIGGGPSVFNAEPVADFFDAFLLGDGEEAALEIADAVIKAKKEGLTRAQTIKSLSGIGGVYIPSYFEPIYNADGTIQEIRPLVEGYESVLKRVVLDLSTLPAPVSPVVPYVEAIHDRFSLEIARGCTRGCRFCHAGMVTRPARERDPADIMRMLKSAVRNTGYDEVSLLSLSTGDYCSIEPLLSALMDSFEDEKVAVSLPSLRVGTLGEGLMSEIKKVKKTGFTLAPEAGTERLRTVINKGIEARDLIETAKKVYGLGWRSIKLYFMIGLPTETKEDIDGIVDLAKAVRDSRPGGGGGYYKGKRRGGPGNTPVSVSVGTFVPKPFTPFQWVSQMPIDECREKQRYLRDEVEACGLRLKWNDARMSELEGVFSRGDRRLSGVVLRAFKMGARFDGWSDEFDFKLWKEALEAEGVDTDFYTVRERSTDEVLPWDHLDVGVTKAFLIAEYKNSLTGEQCPDCKVDICTNCGVCDHKIIKNIVFNADSLKTEADEVSVKGAQAGGERDGERVRVRVNFSKSEPLSFLSHLEMKESIFRAIKRAGVPIFYSGGFHPMPKVSFLDPTPVGMVSFDEYMDIDFIGPVKVDEAIAAIKVELPTGLDIIKAGQISLQLPSLSASITGTKYLILIKNSPRSLEELGIEFDSLEGKLKAFREQASIEIRVRRADKDKVIDIKPLLAEFVLSDDGSIKLSFNNFAGPRVKPHEVLSKLLNISLEDSLLIPIHKTETVLE